MTKDEKYDFMLKTLKVIADDYQTPDELRESSEDEFGLEYEEALEMAYENIQSVAAAAAITVQNPDQP